MHGNKTEDHLLELAECFVLLTDPKYSNFN
jgi:hypothetical protein